jgi:phosphoglycerol transferase MdoB-like AlkP superfamily enzyme
MKWKAEYEHYLLRAFLRDLAFLFLTSYGIVALLQMSFGSEIDIPWLGLTPAVLIINCLIVATPMLTWSFLIDARALSLVSLVSAAGFSYLNHRKIRELGEPIELLDFYNFQASHIIFRYLGRRELLAMGALLTLPFAYRFAANRLWRKKRPWVMPHFFYASITAGLIAVFVVICAEPFRDNSVLLAALPPHPDHADSSRRFGMPLSSILNLKFLQAFHPNNYSEEVVRSLVSLRPTVAPETLKTHDVVLVLLESFRDYSLDGIAYRQDPIPFYHRLKKESLVGSFYSPGVGGGTANVEYEVLSGMSMAFLPKNSIPYLQYVDHDIPSAAGWLTMAGYESFAIHNNIGTYFDRQRVYKTFKFKEFFDLLAFKREFGPHGDGSYPDHYVFEKSLQLLHKRNGKPQFQYLLTLNTHSPYAGFEPEKEWIAPDSYDDADLALEMNVYADRLHKLDSELERYFGEIKKMKNPPTVILFGDHHPSMSLQLPFPNEGARHKVEAVIWNERSGLRLSAGTKPMSCLAPVLLHSSGVPATPFMEFVQKFCDDHLFTGPITVTSKNVKELAGYEILCYDRLFGHKFSTPTSLQRIPGSPPEY